MGVKTVRTFIHASKGFPTVYTYLHTILAHGTLPKPHFGIVKEYAQKD